MQFEKKITSQQRTKNIISQLIQTFTFMFFGVDSFEEFQQYLESFYRIKINGKKEVEWSSIQNCFIFDLETLQDKQSK